MGCTHNLSVRVDQQFLFLVYQEESLAYDVFKSENMFLIPNPTVWTVISIGEPRLAEGCSLLQRPRDESALVVATGS